MFENIVLFGTIYLQLNPSIKSMIVGLSGGIDSALTAAIAREICDITGRHRLIGVSIPIESNKQTEIDNGRSIGNAFCHEFREVKFINNLFKLFKLFKGRPRTQAGKIRRGNIKARLRMIYLYDKAHRNNGLVLSTDNLFEFNLGFWTLHGDVGDLGFIQQLWKTEVYGVAGYLCEKYDRLASGSEDWEIYYKKILSLRQSMTAVPTDGLGVSTSDFDQLGVSTYNEVDRILIDHINGADIKAHPIIKRHVKYAFKRENPHNISREQILS